METEEEKILRDIFKDVLSYTSDTPIIPVASFEQLVKSELERRKATRIGLI